MIEIILPSFTATKNNIFNIFFVTYFLICPTKMSFKFKVSIPE